MFLDSPGLTSVQFDIIQDARLREIVGCSTNCTCKYT